MIAKAGDKLQGQFKKNNFQLHCMFPFVILFLKWAVCEDFYYVLNLVSKINCAIPYIKMVHILFYTHILFCYCKNFYRSVRIKIVWNIWVWYVTLVQKKWLLIQNVFMPMHLKVGGILFYPCLCIHLTLVCSFFPNNSFYSFNAKKFSLCRMFVHRLKMCIFLGF